MIYESRMLHADIFVMGETEEYQQGYDGSQCQNRRIRRGIAEVTADDFRINRNRQGAGTAGI